MSEKERKKEREKLQKQREQTTSISRKKRAKKKKKTESWFVFGLKKVEGARTQSLLPSLPSLLSPTALS